jgi:hypothetical protein
MRLGEAPGDQAFDRLADQFGLRVPEHPQERAVGDRDPSGGVESDDAIRRRLEERSHAGPLHREVAAHRLHDEDPHERCAHDRTDDAARDRRHDVRHLRHGSAQEECRRDGRQTNEHHGGDESSRRLRERLMDAGEHCARSLAWWESLAAARRDETNTTLLS